MEEAKKMKCYKRLIYKQFVQVFVVHSYITVTLYALGSVLHCPICKTSSCFLRALTLISYLIISH